VECTDDERAAISDAAGRAIEASGQAGKSGIAAAVLKDGKVLSQGENEVHLENDPTRHAEMVAIASAAQALGSTDLSGCVLISTLQPCEMCLAAMRFAGVRRVVFSARQENVAEKYFVFGHLKIGDFARGGDFDYVGGVEEDRVLHLYVDGQE
jgi:tRNA(adenine34) deaminase